MENRVCGNCLYWGEYDFTSDGDGTSECRFYPPKVSDILLGGSVASNRVWSATIYPVVHYNGKSCSKWTLSPNPVV